MQLKLKSRLNIFSMKLWNEYIKTDDFKEIFNYISSELEVFTSYFEELFKKIKNRENVS